MEKNTTVCPECGSDGKEISRYSPGNETEKIMYLCSNKNCQHGQIQSPFVITTKASLGPSAPKKRGRPPKQAKKVEEEPPKIIASVDQSVEKPVPVEKTKPDFNPVSGKSAEPEMQKAALELARSSKNRVCVFIDGTGFYFALKRNSHATRVNYYELSKALAGPDRSLVRTYYFNSAYDPVLFPEQHKGQQPFLESLAKIPYLELRLGRIIPQKEGGFREKGSDLRLASELVYYAAQDFYDTAVLITENTDLSPAISHVKELGKHVELWLFSDSQPKELVHFADRAVPLNEVFKRFSSSIFPDSPESNFGNVTKNSFLSNRLLGAGSKSVLNSKRVW